MKDYFGDFQRISPWILPIFLTSQMVKLGSQADFCSSIITDSGLKTCQVKIVIPEKCIIYLVKISLR